MISMFKNDTLNEYKGLWCCPGVLNMKIMISESSDEEIYTLKMSGNLLNATMCTFNPTFSLSGFQKHSPQSAQRDAALNRSKAATCTL